MALCVGWPVLSLGDGAAPERIAVSVAGTEDRLTYGDLFRLSDDLGASLWQQPGISVGDTVASCLPRDRAVLQLVAFLGTTGSRLVAAPLNPDLRSDDLRFYIEDARTRCLLVAPCQPDGGCRGQDAAAGLGVPVCQIALEFGARVAAPRLSVAPRGPPRGGGRPGQGPQPSDPALLLHTSGTTSRPKCVPLTHRNLSASVRSVVRWYQLTASDSTLVVQPIFHVGGLVTPLLSTLASGGSCALGVFQAEAFWRWVRLHGVTWFTCVPSVHRVLLARAPLDFPAGGAPPPRLRFMRSGSAPLGAEVAAAIEAAFGCPLIEAYGMTEAAQLLCANPLPPRPRKAGSVGLPAGPELSLRDPGTGRPVAAGEPGEVCARGAAVFGGYLHGGGADGEAFRDGWFRTGDLAVQDEDGYITIVGRLKEMIKRGGEQVSPARVDRALAGIPGLSRVISFGSPHAVWGQVVHVAAVAEGEAGPGRSREALSGALLRRAAEVLLPQEVPERVFFVAEGEVPVTPTGKVQRARLPEVCRRASGSASASTRDSTSPGSDPGSDGGRGAELRGLVRRIAALVREMGGSSDLQPDEPFLAGGVTSILMQLLAAKLSLETGLADLPGTLMLSYPTPSALARYLLDRKAGRAPADLDGLGGLDQLGDPLRPAEAAACPEGRTVTSVEGRVPQAESWDGFWEIIRGGQDVVGTVPEDRWASTELDAAGLDERVARALRFGGFLPDISYFDNALFGVRPAEARLMDPQQRLLLEQSYAALRAAGHDRRALEGADLGVFVGIAGHDFAQLTLHAGCGSPLASSGCLNAMAAGRVSFALGLRGPCQAVDTSCSSALVAAANAQALCGAAVASGVSVILSPTLGISFGRKGILSPDGRCKTFDAGADGYVRSEACVSCCLERADRAAVDTGISSRGAVSRHDGASASLTAPSRQGQLELHAAAAADSRVPRREIAYVESHGTGTVLGDPIEVNAQTLFFGGALRAARAPLAVGGVKANMGHAEACAGLAGLWKLVLSLRHGLASANAKLRVLNPLIASAAAPLEGLLLLPTECLELPARAAGLATGEVASLGANGTIAAAVAQAAQGRTFAAPARVAFARQDFPWRGLGRPWAEGGGPRRPAEAGPGEAGRADAASAVAALIQQHLGLEGEVGGDVPLLDAGFDSLSALELQSALAEAFGLHLPPGFLSRHPTPARIAAYLAAHARGAAGPEQDPAASGCVRKLRDGVGNVFMIHGIDGDVLATLYLRLAQELPYSFHSLVFLDAARESCRDVAALADYYISCIKGVQPQGPYVIGGYSFGSIIAHAVALRLEAAGEGVAGLVLGDFEVAYPPTKFAQRPAEQEAGRIGVGRWEGGALEALTLACRRFGRQSGGFDEAAYQERMRGAASAEEREMRAMYYYMPEHMSRKEWKEYIGLWASAMDGLHSIVMPDSATAYEPPRLVSAPTLLLRALDSPEFASAVPVNRRYCSKLDVAEFHGTHYTLLQPPHVGPVAAAVEAWLQQLI